MDRTYAKLVEESREALLKISDDGTSMVDYAVLARIASDPDLPTPGPIALQVVQCTHRPDCKLSDIAQLIQQDPALAARMLKTINSAMFGLPRAVTSIERAVVLLGLKTVRSLVLAAALTSLRNDRLPTAWSRVFWLESVAGASIARSLAPRCGSDDVEDDFVAALLRDLGALVLVRLFPKDYPEICNLASRGHLETLCELERARFGIDHAEVAALLIRKWNLPDTLADVIQVHHVPEKAGPEAAPRAKRLYFASCAAHLLACPSDTLQVDVLRLAQEWYQMAPQELMELLEPQHERIGEFAHLFDIDIGRCERFADVLASATTTLATIAIENELEVTRAREAAKAAERETTRWRRTAYRLRRQAQRDPLTGVHNRGYFEEALIVEFKRAERRAAVVGLIFLDLDGFKRLNDEFGHPFGDQVLRDVASSLRSEVRSGDIVARYGGDEFCVIASDTCESGIESLANRLWKRVSGLTVRRGGRESGVGVSIGAVACLPHRTHHTYEEFLTSADEAMYTAKTTGRNRVTFLSLVNTKEADFLREVENRMFRRYLQLHGLATEKQVSEAARLVPTPGYCIGRLARQLRWISPRKLRRVLESQRHTRKRFGEIAVEKGYLSREQVYALLAIQRERPDDLCESLVDLGVLDAAQSKQIVQNYYRWVVEAPAATKLAV